MDQETVGEIARAIGTRLGREFPVDPRIPVEIKYWLERLRLSEFLAEARRQAQLRDVVTSHVATTAG